jgi:hypothetical protein
MDVSDTSLSVLGDIVKSDGRVEMNVSISTECKVVSVLGRCFFTLICSSTADLCLLVAVVGLLMGDQGKFPETGDDLILSKAVAADSSTVLLLGSVLSTVFPVSRTAPYKSVSMPDIEFVVLFGVADCVLIRRGVAIDGSRGCDGVSGVGKVSFAFKASLLCTISVIVLSVGCGTDLTVSTVWSVFS